MGPPKFVAAERGTRLDVSHDIRYVFEDVSFQLVYFSVAMIVLTRSDFF
jgi:hypothetical protein